jgi:hypothetical protein
MRDFIAVADKPSRWRVALGGVIVLFILGASPAARSQTAKASPPIYSCVDSNGKKVTSDRPIPECNSRDQRVLNSDGSVNRVMPPVPTADERTEIEARERDVLADRALKQEAIRRDRNLLARFPNEAAHRKARETALEDVRKSLRVSETRLAALAVERKPLMDETEFYVGKQLPLKLKTQLDANDATLEAQRALFQNQQQELDRINKRYDDELDRLRKLWSGAQPGSIGMLPVAAASATAKK